MIHDLIKQQYKCDFLFLSFSLKYNIRYAIHHTQSSYHGTILHKSVINSDLSVEVWVNPIRAIRIHCTGHNFFLHSVCIRIRVVNSQSNVRHDLIKCANYRKWNSINIIKCCINIQNVIITIFVWWLNHATRPDNTICTYSIIFIMRQIGCELSGQYIVITVISSDCASTLHEYWC